MIRSLERSLVTLAAVTLLLSCGTSGAALAAGAVTLLVGPLAVLLWSAAAHPGAATAAASATTGAIALAAFRLAWRWRAREERAWGTVAASFAAGQAALGWLCWRDPIALPRRLALAPLAALVAAAAVGVSAGAVFWLLWGDGKGFGE